MLVYHSCIIFTISFILVEYLHISLAEWLQNIQSHIKGRLDIEFKKKYICQEVHFYNNTLHSR